MEQPNQDRTTMIINLISALEPVIVDLIVKLRKPDGTVVDMNLVQLQDEANLKQALDWLAEHNKK